MYQSTDSDELNLTGGGELDDRKMTEEQRRAAAAENLAKRKAELR